MPHCPTRGAKNAASSGSGERWEKQSCNDEDLSKSAEHGYYRAMRIARLGRRTCVPRFGIAFMFLFGQLSDHYIRHPQVLRTANIELWSVAAAGGGIQASRHR